MDNYLIEKRKEVLQAIEPICKGFNIINFDYVIGGEIYEEVLQIENIQINCNYNSIQAIKDELLAYIFVTKYNRNSKELRDIKEKIQNGWIKK